MRCGPEGDPEGERCVHTPSLAEAAARAVSHTPRVQRAAAGAEDRSEHGPASTGSLMISGWRTSWQIIALHITTRPSAASSSKAKSPVPDSAQSSVGTSCSLGCTQSSAPRRSTTSATLCTRQGKASAAGASGDTGQGLPTTAATEASRHAAQICAAAARSCCAVVAAITSEKYLHAARRARSARSPRSPRGGRVRRAAHAPGGRRLGKHHYVGALLARPLDGREDLGQVDLQAAAWDELGHGDGKGTCSRLPRRDTARSPAPGPDEARGAPEGEARAGEQLGVAVHARPGCRAGAPS